MGTVRELQTAGVNGSSSRPVHPRPVPHIRRSASGPIRGWSSTYRPLPAPRLLLSPYLGCPVGCDFCFLPDYPGAYRLAFQKNIATVYRDYDKHLQKELSRLRVAPPAVLSPLTEPFQPVNERYHLSERVVKVCVLQNLSLELVSRRLIPEEVVAMMQYLTESRIHISIDPLGREGDVPSAAERLDQLRWIKNLGLSVMLRMDPLMPAQNQKEWKRSCRRLLRQYQQRGGDHVLVGFARLNSVQLEEYGIQQDEGVQKAPEGLWWEPDPSLKKRALLLLRSWCEELGLSLGVLNDASLQDEFGSFSSPVRSPLSLLHRASSGDPFQPLKDCPGDCLRCPDPVCDLPELQGIPNRETRLTSRTWDEWGRNRLQADLIP